MCASIGRSADGTQALALCTCRPRHARRLVCAVWVPVPRARSHQRGGAHRADVARESPGEQVCARHHSKDRSSSRRLNFGFPKLALECLSASLSIDLLWVPSWGNPADAPSRGTSLACWKRSLPIWPAQAPTLQFGSAAVARELKLIREPLPNTAVQKMGACHQPADESPAKVGPNLY